MSIYKCEVCGFIHDEKLSGAFNKLDSDWVCPLCKMGKDKFSVKDSGTANLSLASATSKHLSTDIRVPIELDNPSICRDDDICIKCNAV